MDHLEYPTLAEWTARREWFEAQFDIERRGGGYIWGEHASGLLVDLQSVFCAGAYVTCVILACTIIDAHLREAELGPKFDGGIQAAFEYCDDMDDLNWLRRRRNELIHFKSSRDLAISIEEQWDGRTCHEHDARRSIMILSEILFDRPFV